MYTSTQTHSHKLGPSTALYSPHHHPSPTPIPPSKKRFNKNMRPQGHTAKACPTLQNGAIAKERPRLQK